MIYRHSDVKIKLANGKVPGHRFVLTARADNWLPSNITWNEISELGLLIKSNILFLRDGFKFGLNVE